MGDYGEFSIPIRLFLKAYPWRVIDPVPWTPLKKKVEDSRIALVSSAGFVPPGQIPFDETIKGGDWSFRHIPDDTRVKSLEEFHRSESFDHQGLNEDQNLAFPLDRLHELAAAKKIGNSNHRHFSFMGSIVAPGRLIKETAPDCAQFLVEDEVDAALFVPV